jgi:hypothetical protein
LSCISYVIAVIEMKLCNDATGHLSRFAVEPRA